MNKIIISLILCGGMLLTAYASQAQYRLQAQVLDGDSGEPLPGATAVLEGEGRGATANEHGLLILEGIPEGEHIITFSFLGYSAHKERIRFPGAPDTIRVHLRAEGEEMEQVIITSTRSTRTIEDLPTRVEFIGGEELEEKGNMRPGDIRILLNESTGIQTQQVSATSANASIRIQGLDGRYTQMLKDGFPLYGGFSGGLGLLQTPPLDLKQVEVIKGATSTLYGGGAIAGLVNLISRVPEEERDLRLLLNATSAGGLDVNGFYAEKYGKTGLSLFASRNSTKAYDPSSTGFTAIPETERYVLNPKLFVYFSPNTTMSLGLNGVLEDRTGGDIRYIEGQGDSTHRYFERNKSRRYASQFSLEHVLGEGRKLNLRNALSRFGRIITIPGYRFDGTQWSSYSEAAYSHQGEQQEWIAGLNYYTDHFREAPEDEFPQRDYAQHTLGAFVQYSRKASDWLELEGGLRGDYVTDYGFALLPRISALLRISPSLSSRLGGGMGYKAPSIFTEETERIQFRAVAPLDPDLNRLEYSHGANFDINFRTTILDKLSLSLNQLFFYTRIDHPLLLESQPAGMFRLENYAGHIDSKGWETNLKLGYGDLKLFLGYTFTDAWLKEEGWKRRNPLTARHRLNNVLMYEVEEKWKIGLEAYYYSKQELSDGSEGQPYWIVGCMLERIWERFSIFLNFENFSDTRQTRFDTIYTGSPSEPVFRDIYAPLDGFVVNGGLKLRL